jgi:polysaccharide pyruvyl transferase WcaK-like protein
MRLALLNLRYSPNLGDVLLCECLEYGLRRAIPGLEIVALDLGGRRDFARGGKRRLAALAILQRLPKPARQQVARIILGRSLRRTLPYWTAALADADGAVLGGGNLFADADLNFPLKIAAALGAVAAAGLPAAVHAVGVSDNWSREGQALFQRGLAGVRLVHASVRDARSRDIWARRLGALAIADPVIARDPGLLAADCYAAAPRPPGPGRRVGICAIHPVALSYHADDDVPGARDLTAWFAGLVSAFTARGDAVSLFTTGSPEDEAYLDAVMPALRAAAAPAGQVARVPRFAGAGDLAGFVATLDLLLAHRLHACIAAYSFGIPHVGFTWDLKMRGFFDSVGRGRFLRGAAPASVAAVAELAEEAARVGIDPAARAAVMAETQDDIARLARGLTGARVTKHMTSGA